MVLKGKQTTVAYRCPHCGSGVLSAVDIFSLGGDMLKLKCDCGESSMTIVKSSDGKIRLQVPCLFCPTPHNFTVNSAMFFEKDLFVIPCPYTDINICFLGNIDKVRTELDRTELALIDMLGEENIQKLAENEKDSPLTDPQIFDIIMFVIRELDAENKIFCRCNVGEGDFEVEITDDGIKLACKNCGASQLIPTDSLLGAHAFLHCDSLHLE
jgi:predicted RNA-binding Zn-ribbon protein involved in translation (DUF1610 family)